MGMKRVQMVISGRVQGVGYRASCQHEAISLGLTGWVCNRWDGAVEALFEGEAAAVDAMVDWCRDGPPMAYVSGNARQKRTRTESHGLKTQFVSPPTY